MRIDLATAVRASAIVSLLAAVGCSKTLKEVHFQPLPKAEVGTQDLAPIQPRPVTDLLREADKAFQEANVSQEKGDYEASLRHYTRMLELLIEADLDPTVFYNLRGEFERILKSGTEHARLFEERGRIQRWSQEDFAGTPVRGDLEIPFPLPARVLQEIDEIQSGYPKNFQRGLDRSFKYLPYIQEEFAKAGLPQDLVWLAMVESQFYPTAVSPAGATGMWQFMGATGRRYGLNANSYVDDRRNWEKATQAAVKYLTDLRDQFEGNWPLAISSYNMGEYGMERAMNMNGGETNLWKLIEEPPAANHIKLETKKFYPKLLATILVAKNPDRYGFTVSKQPLMSTLRVPVNGGLKLSTLEKASGLPEGALKELNPDLLKGVTPPGSQHMVAVPVDSGERVLAAASSLAPESQVTLAKLETEEPAPDRGKGKSFKRSTKTHVVRKGETLGKIASQHDTTVRELMEANRLRSEKKLMVGQKLSIPTSHGEEGIVVAKDEEKPAASKEVPVEVAAATPVRTDIPETYRVRRGDTLFDIAERFDVPVKDLRTWNNMGKGSGLRIGDELRLRGPATETLAKAEAEEPVEEAEETTASADTTTASDSPPNDSATHVVASGEFPGKIAEMYGVGLSEFLKANNLTSKSTLMAGAKVVIPNPKKQPESSTTTTLAKADDSEKKSESNSDTTTHKVAKGETPSTIASKYGVKTADLLAWNGLTAKSTIHVGDSLKINGKSAASTEEPVKLAKVDVNTQADKPVEVVAESTKSASSESKRIEHTVAKGEVPGAIAQQYNVKMSDLRKWNNWSGTPVLQIGSKVVVFVQ